MRASRASSGFLPGQIWQPKRGHPGPPVKIVNVHRADRAVETIDANTPDADTLTAKRTVIRFRDLRDHYRPDQDTNRFSTTPR